MILLSIHYLIHIFIHTHPHYDHEHFQNLSPKFRIKERNIKRQEKVNQHITDAYIEKINSEHKEYIDTFSMEDKLKLENEAINEFHLLQIMKGFKIL